MSDNPSCHAFADSECRLHIKSRLTGTKQQFNTQDELNAIVTALGGPQVRAGLTGIDGSLDDRGHNTSDMVGLWSDSTIYTPPPTAVVDK